MSIVRNLIAVILFILLLLFANTVTLFTINTIYSVFEDSKRSELESKLDAYELHFDADSYFVVINAKYGDIGIYYGNSPLKHFQWDVEWGGTKWAGDLKDLPDIDIILPEEVTSFLDNSNFPENPPVVITQVEVI